MAHRYWRLLCTHANSFLRCSECEMRATSGGADQTSTAFAIADSEFSGSTPATFAFDGDLATRWLPTNKTVGLTSWIGQDFGSDTTVAEATYRNSQISGQESHSPSQIEIQYSDDGIDWTTTDTYSGLTWTLGETKTFSVTDSGGGDTTDALLAEDVSAGTPTVGTPSIGQTHVITADDLSAGAPSVSTPDLGQVHVLAANDVSAGTPSVSSPALAVEGIVSLLADDVSAGVPSVSQPALGQVHVLGADDVSSGIPSVSTPVLNRRSRDGGDDAPARRQRRRRMSPEQVIAIIEAIREAEEQGKPAPTRRKRKVLARKIVEASGADHIFTPARKPVERMVREQVAAVYTPGVSWTEISRAVSRIVEAAQEEARRIEQEIEEEDEMILLLAA